MIILLRKILKNQNGQALVLFALLIPIFIGFLGLSIDVGNVMYQKQKMQNAIDLSILAGIQELPGNTSHAVQVTKDYWELNGFERDNIQVKTNYKEDPNKIHAESTRTIPLFFMSLFHINSTDVTVSAAAEVISATSSHPAFDYVLFSGSTTEAFKGSYGDSLFDGNVHCNHDINSSGGNNTFNGNLEVVGEIELKDNDVFNGSVINPASVIPLPEYDIEELKSKATTIYDGNFSASGSLNLNGILFVDGDVSISGGSCEITGKGSIIATGDISVSSSGFHYQSGDDLFALYSLQDITLSGGDKTFEGFLYAPNGKISATGGNDTYHGAVIADIIKFSNDGYHFIYDPRVKEAFGGDSEKKIRLIE